MSGASLMQYNPEVQECDASIAGNWFECGGKKNFKEIQQKKQKPFSDFCFKIIIVRELHAFFFDPGALATPVSKVV